MIGQELCEHLEEQASAHAAHTLEPQYAQAPSLAVVSTDGGRIMTRAEGDRGVHDQAWKETKNACLLTMSSTPCEHDPHPELPTCFKDRALRRTTGAGDPRDAVPRRRIAGKSRRFLGKRGLGRYPLASRRPCHCRPRSRGKSGVPNGWFGRVSAAWFRATSSAHWWPEKPSAAVSTKLSGEPSSGMDKLWNWTLHATHFPKFVGIADFVHPLGYVYDAATVLMPEDPWPLHLRASEACWQGRVSDFLNELRTWQVAHPIPWDQKLAAGDPRSIVQTTVTYLENNLSRMNYPEYRRQGLPVSSCHGGVINQGDELPRQRDGKVLEPARWSREHLANPRRRTLRRRPAKSMDREPTGLVLLSTLHPKAVPAGYPGLKPNPFIDSASFAGAGGYFSTGAGFWTIPC